MRNNNTLPPPVVPLANLPSNATADPFAPVGFTASQSQSEVNFANFDNNPVFANSSFDSDKQEIAWPDGNGTVGNGLPVSQSLNFNQVKSPWDIDSTPNPFHHTLKSLRVPRGRSGLDLAVTRSGLRRPFRWRSPFYLPFSFWPRRPAGQGDGKPAPSPVETTTPTRPTSSGPSGRWCFELGSAHLWPGAWKDLLWYYYGEKSSPPEAQ
ncbi:unnamed protein product [Nesidiocoris tenuis]|uniref:Uncharacterized protein n=1 Tax=Nesidiocoris tenuis TaxID=355587 RepID=A0A6H5GY59_9HEMI|nr:unnamed protein product [Nesidiocoris tenuis]